MKRCSSVCHAQTSCNKLHLGKNVCLREEGCDVLSHLTVEIFYYLRQQGACDCSSCLSVSFCVQDAMVGPTNWNNWSTFGGAPVPDTDSRSIFHFPHHCGIVDFRRFINISHTVTGRLLQNLAKWLMLTRYESKTFWERPGRHRESGSGLIRQSGLEYWITLGWNFGTSGGLRSLSTVLLQMLQLTTCSSFWMHLFC